MPDESFDWMKDPISVYFKPKDENIAKLITGNDYFEVPVNNVTFQFKEEVPMHDPVTNPSHYDGPGGSEAKDVMRDYFGDEFMAHYWLGCALKYLFRYKGKNGEQDLLKARRCIDYLMEVEYGGDGD